MEINNIITLDEAIQHCRDVAQKCNNKACGLEHVQLAQWLIELKDLQQEVKEWRAGIRHTPDTMSKLLELERIKTYIPDYKKYFPEHHV